MQRTVIHALLFLALFAIAGCSKAADNEISREVIPGIPVENTVTLVDLGATTCIPCQLMAPILKELQEEYRGRAAVIFIDVWDEANKGKAKAFQIMTIPTQVFYDKKGVEVYRHLGFLDKETLVAKLEELLTQ